MVFGSFCFKEIWLYSGFCDTIYGKHALQDNNGFEYKWVSGSHTKDKCNPQYQSVTKHTRFEVVFSILIHIAFIMCALPFQTNTFYGQDYGCFHRQACLCKVIAEILILKNTQCYVNKTIAIFYIDSLFCTLQNCESRAQVSIQAQTIV